MQVQLKKLSYAQKCDTAANMRAAGRFNCKVMQVNGVWFCFVCWFRMGLWVL